MPAGRSAGMRTLAELADHSTISSVTGVPLTINRTVPRLSPSGRPLMAMMLPINIDGSWRSVGPAFGAAGRPLGCPDRPPNGLLLDGGAMPVLIGSAGGVCAASEA